MKLNKLAMKQFNRKMCLINENVQNLSLVSLFIN